MISALIVDDEEKSREVLKMLLHAHCPDVRVIADADEVKKAIKMIKTHQPQLVFLDIEMAGETGFDLLESMTERNFHVVFVTAHDEFAVKAFRFSVTDYILKPVDIDELKEAVKKVKGLINIPSSDSASAQTLRIPSTNGLTFVYISNIIRLEADGSYTHIHLDDGIHYMSSYNLKQFEEHLDPLQFIRIHRSHIINLKKIKSVNSKDGLFAEMTDGSRIEVAKRNRAAFTKMIHQKQ